MELDQDDVLEQLCEASAYPHRAETIRRIETHISFVYLTGDFAYKVKKAVKLPFLDFSTLDDRERACRDELTLNRRLAPALYHDVVGIGGDPKSVCVGGTPAIEFAVKITQFPEGAIADELIEEEALSTADFSDFAEHIAAFHQSLAPSDVQSAGERILKNLSEFESTTKNSNRRRQLEDIGAWIRSSVERLGDHFTERNLSGRIRECHGDLHLSNIVRIDEKLIAFDCLEFSLDLRTIDVIDEVAFLFMDLLAYGRSDLAFAWLNQYLTATGDYDGLRLLRLYATHRALVRAKVLPREESRRYIDTASTLTQKRVPLCVITHGFSGSGKTTVARSLASLLKAVHLRSDIERKRRNDLQPTERSNAGIDQGIYSADSTEATYRSLGESAEASLDGGIDIIVDASFLNRRERDRFRFLARKLGSRFVILSLQAERDVLRDRITERNQQNNDASDADLAVLEHQLATADAFGADENRFIVTVATEEDHAGNQLADAIRARSIQESLSSTSS